MPQNKTINIYPQLFHQVHTTITALAFVGVQTSGLKLTFRCCSAQGHFTQTHFASLAKEVEKLILIEKGRIEYAGQDIGVFKIIEEKVFC